MNNVDLSQIKAVAFDIDGTLYRSWKFYVRIFPYFLCHNIFFLKYGLVRKTMHGSSYTPDFVKVQAEQMAKKLHCSPEEAEARLEKVIYKGLEKYFTHIKPCKGSVEFVKNLKEHGYKVALLSDFPPEQKGDIWGIKEMCDVVLGTEQAGALKPESVSFLKLAELLELKPEQILYVGNNHKYDVIGSHKVGMKSAWITLPSIIKKHSKVAEITFCHYKQLSDIFFTKKSGEKTE